MTFLVLLNILNVHVFSYDLLKLFKKILNILLSQKL